MNELYELLAQFIRNTEGCPENLNIVYQYLDDSMENTLGIILFSAGNEQPYVSGGYPLLSIAIHLQYNVSKSRQATIEAIPFMEKLITLLETQTLFNESIEVGYMQHTGPRVLPIGMNKNGIGHLVSNVMCKYTLT